MVRAKHDRTFRSFLTDPEAPFLQTRSDTFGLVERSDIERSVVAAARRYRRSLLVLADDLRNGSIGAQRYNTQSRAATRIAYFYVYSLGALSVFPFYTMTGRDVEILDAALDEESGFLRKFGSDIRHDRLDIALVQRAGLYLLGLRGIFEKGRLAAMPVRPLRWRLGITDHCFECYNAADRGPYQRDSYSGLGLPTIPGVPGDGTVCEGLTRCGCRVVDAAGIPIPGEDIADSIHGLLMEVVHESSPVARRAAAE